MIYIKTAKAACLLVALSVSATGLAQGVGRVTVKRDVSTAGLDLASAEGVALLDARISQTVRHMCGERGVDLQARMAHNRCRREAMGSTSRQVELAVAKARNARLAARPSSVEMAAAKGL